MATAQVDDVALSVRVGRQKLSLYVKRKDTIGYVVKKATAQLKEPEEKKYMLLYKGSVVSEELKVGVSNINWKKSFTRSFFRFAGCAGKGACYGCSPCAANGRSHGSAMHGGANTG